MVALDKDIAPKLQPPAMFPCHIYRKLANSARNFVHSCKFDILQFASNLHKKAQANNWYLEEPPMAFGLMAITRAVSVTVCWERTREKSY